MKWAQATSVTALSLAVVLGSFGLAAAHSQVISTTPEAGSTSRESPLSVSVTTAENLLDLGGNQAGFAMVVTDSEGLYYGTGCVELVERTLTTTVDLGEAGDYVVTYQLVSEDGHTISDRFSFSFTPDTSHSPATPQTLVPVCGEEPQLLEESAAAPSESEVNDAPVEKISAPSDDTSPGIGTVVAGSLGTVAALTALAAVWWRRRN